MEPQPKGKSAGRAHLFLAGITAAVLAPFLNKAFHIDDPLFIWIGQHITRHPLDPYGFDVNWVSVVQPMSVVMQNPPLCSFYIAAVGSVFGWSEIALHSAFLIPAILVVLGTFAVARQFLVRPFWAALLTLFTPVFLVSATGVMCDVMMLAFWLWAVAFWLVASARKSSALFVTSAALICAATFTKYFGIALVPLLAVYTLMRERRVRAELLCLLVPVLLLVVYDLLTADQYGHGLFRGATLVSSSISSVRPQSYPTQVMIGLAFTGGCVATVAFFLHFRRKVVALGIATAFVCAIAFKLLLSRSSFGAQPAVWIEGGIFSAIALLIIAASVSNFVSRKTPETLLLVLWIAGTFCFAAFLNWSITARTILPLAPAVAILVVQFSERMPRSARLEMVAVVASATLSLLITASDFLQANSARAVSRSFQQRYAGEAERVHFLGHWGFQYYMDGWGAKPFDRRKGTLTSGDILVWPHGDRIAAAMSLNESVAEDRLVFRSLPFISAFAFTTGAGFYTSFVGPLPWVMNGIPPERYYARRVR